MNPFGLLNSLIYKREYFGRVQIICRIIQGGIEMVKVAVWDTDENYLRKEKRLVDQYMRVHGYQYCIESPASEVEFNDYRRCLPHYFRDSMSGSAC